MRAFLSYKPYTSVGQLNNNHFIPYFKLTDYTFLFKKVLEPVIQSVTRDWQGASADWKNLVMIKHAARARLFSISGLCILGGCYLGFAIAPLFNFNIRIINNITDYGDRWLIVQSYYPWDYSITPIFELTCVSQVTAAFFVGTYSAGVKAGFSIVRTNFNKTALSISLFLIVKFNTIENLQNFTRRTNGL